MAGPCAARALMQVIGDFFVSKEQCWPKDEEADCGSNHGQGQGLCEVLNCRYLA